MSNAANTSDDQPADELNEDVLVGLAADGDELSWRYKTALAPDSYKRHTDGDEVKGEYGEIDGEYYTQTLEVRDWPAIPAHGFFDRVVSFSMPKVDVTLSTHLTGENERKADRNLAGAADSLKGRVKSLAKNKWIPDYFVEEAATEYADIKRTQNTVSASEYGLYTSHTYIEVRAPDPDTLDTAIKQIRSRMQDVSADAKPLKYHSQLGYQTAAPACKDFMGGKTKMTGDGLSRLIPWTARNLIEPGGIELGINEDTGDPIVLDLQNRETGFNVGVWGTIGSGKTTTVTRLLSRLKMSNPDMPVVIIDPKEEFAGFTWLFDGDRVVIGSDTGINPLQIEETAAEKLEEIGEEAPYRNAIRRAMDFIRSFYDYQGIPFEDKQGTWRKAIQKAYRQREITQNPETHDKESPTFAEDVFPIFLEMIRDPEKHVEDELDDVDLSKDELQKTANDIYQNDIGALKEDGEFAHLSQETSIPDLQEIDVLYLDLQNYESETTAGLMMGPLVTAVLELAKKSDEPMALAMDEFHYMLHNSSSLETLKQGYRHSRHSDLSMITATQSVEEFFTESDDGGQQLTESASTLTNLMSVKIWHYLEEMNEDWAGEFDMSESEQQYIDDASTGDPTAQALLQTQKKGSYRMDVNFSDKLNPREFAMNQYDPTDHGSDPLSYLDGYTDRTGRDVTEWSWSMPTETDEQQTETELADGRTVTTDVSDVDTVPGDGAGSAHSPSESASSEEETEPSNPDASEPDDSQESGGIASRLKDSVSGVVGGNSTIGSVEDPELNDIHGTISARMTADIRAAGFESVEDVFEADNSALAEVEGIDVPKAVFIRRHAAKTLGRSPSVIESPETTDKRDEAAADAESSSESGENDDDQPEAPQPSDASDADESADAAEQSRESADSQPVLTDIREVGGDRADVLREAGFESVEDVAATSESALSDVEGIGAARAETIIESANDLCSESLEAAMADGAGGEE
ncbi:helix-hairpin-helix domain-containing protein (plasmid) [Halococcus dombrowskii]|uniref:Helix-hairpin-helix domain-containing protein n=1 Tax=Halococcus dombrowskii TaxID=179637 RepID=A0AAV3SI19_HALDO|nr:helix-hairpin-helix domain-containing protein [Halococcus dombrowskii]UOO97295.1 helix-hairpin-helix domain-containing protein [Halococcus dombrowskii]